MTKSLKNKIKSIKIESNFQKHWLSDPRFSKDGVEGIVYPLLTRGSPTAEIILNEPLTNYQRNKLIGYFPKGCQIYWLYEGILKQL